MGAFNDYVDTMLLFFDHHLPLPGHFLTPKVDKNMLFLTTDHPFLVNVVIERPLLHLKFQNHT